MFLSNHNLLQTPSSGYSEGVIVVGCGVVREELEVISDDVIITEQDIELTEGDTASKGSQSLPRITAVNRGALSCDSREVQKHRMSSSDRTAGLA